MIKWMLASLIAGIIAAHACGAEPVRVAVQSTKSVPDETIAGVAAQVVRGALKEMLSRPGRDALDLQNVLSAVRAAQPRVWIDGEEQDGFWGWVRAAYRVAGYAVNRRHEGSVRLTYRLTLEGYPLARESLYRDDLVALTTTTGWTEVVPVLRDVRRIPIAIQDVLLARQTAAGVVFAGTASGCAKLDDFRCRWIRGVAAGKTRDGLTDGLTELLETIEVRGAEFYHTGRLPEKIQQVRRGFRKAFMNRRR
jgi:hypothetical protein